MLQMMTKYLFGWEMWVWKKFKLVYKKPLPKPKSLGKGGKNVSGLVLKAGCDIKNNNFCEVQIHQQIDYVWRNLWI